MDRPALAELSNLQLNASFEICSCCAKHLPIAYFASKLHFLRTCKPCHDIHGTTQAAKRRQVAVADPSTQENQGFIAQLTSSQISTSSCTCLRCKNVQPISTFHIGNAEWKMCSTCCDMCAVCSVCTISPLLCLATSTLPVHLQVGEDNDSEDVVVPVVDVGPLEHSLGLPDDGTVEHEVEDVSFILGDLQGLTFNQDDKEYDQKQHVQAVLSATGMIGTDLQGLCKLPA